MRRLPAQSQEPAFAGTRPAIRFDRNELSGAFGDMGTDVPLIIGVALASHLDGASVLIMFGAMQILTGLAYRMPMPVQPLKAMAAIVIAQQTAPEILYGAGIAIGLTMLILASSGALTWLARVVPKSVVRGIQFGLGLQLASISLQNYVRAESMTGYLLAGLAFVIVVLLLGNRRLPAALPVVALGLAIAAYRLDPSSLAASVGLHLPTAHVPQLSDIATGFVLLALPQIPLSLGNSVLATRQLAHDLFPERNLTIRKIGIGLPFGSGFDHVVRAFPLPILGVLLLFEALSLVWLIRDTADSRLDFPIAALVGLIAVGLPYGYLVGMVVGTILVWLGARANLVNIDKH